MTQNTQTTARTSKRETLVRSTRAADGIAARMPVTAARMRAIRLAHGQTRGQCKRNARALYRAADIVAARGDGNEAARIRRVADDYRAAMTYARFF